MDSLSLERLSLRWRDNMEIMACAECDAFTAAYNMASAHYAEAVATLHKQASNGEFRSEKYPKLKADVEKARNACEMARAALRVHRGGHQK